MDYSQNTPIAASLVDDGTFDPTIRPHMMGKHYRTVAPKRFQLGNVKSMPADLTIHRVAEGDTGYKFYPYWHKAVVIGQPAVAPTASVMTKNSWDWKFGLVNTPISPITESNAVLPIAPVPTMGM